MLFFLCFTLAATGQSHFIGAKGGYSWTNIATDAFAIHKTQCGFSFGLTYDFVTGKKFSFSSELLYEKRGYTNELIITDDRETRQDRIGRNYSTVMVLVLARIISLQISSLISNGIVIKQAIIDSLIQNYTSFINEINEGTAQQLLFSKGKKWTAGQQFRKWLNC